MRKAKNNILLLLFPICLFSCGKSVDYYKNEGDSNFQSNDFQGAVAEFTKAIELYPKYPSAFLSRGASKINLNDKNGACLDWSMAGELGSEKAYELIQKYCQ